MPSRRRATVQRAGCRTRASKKHRRRPTVTSGGRSSSRLARERRGSTSLAQPCEPVASSASSGSRPVPACYGTMCLRAWWAVFCAAAFVMVHRPDASFVYVAERAATSARSTHTSRCSRSRTSLISGSSSGIAAPLRRCAAEAARAPNRHSLGSVCVFVCVYVAYLFVCGFASWQPL
jgi:hypothetical protein